MFFSDVYQTIDELDLSVSDFSSNTAMSEDKDIFRGINLFEKLMACNNPAIDLVNDNKYTRFRQILNILC